MAHVKDVYTFLHDCNARNDPKLKQFRVKYGAEAYAFYFMVLEMCREEPTYTLNVRYVDGYAHDLNLSVERFNELLDGAVCIGLLSIEDDCIFSPALLKRMEEYDAKRERLKANALSRSRGCKANAEQLQSRCSASEYIEQEQEHKQEQEIDFGGGPGGGRKRKPATAEAFKLPDRSGNERKPHPDFPLLWFSDAELERIQREAAEVGLRPEFLKFAFEGVEGWFSEGEEGQKAYRISKEHYRRVIDFGLTKALSKQKDTLSAAILEARRPQEQQELFKAPDGDGNARKPHKHYPRLWFSDAELERFYKLADSRGLKRDYRKYAFAKVDTWFGEDPKGKQVYRSSEEHYRRLVDWGLDAALEKQRLTDSTAKASGTNVQSTYLRS